MVQGVLPEGKVRLIWFFDQYNRLLIMIRVLVTGASGFVGLALCKALHHSPNYEVSAAVRSRAQALHMPTFAVGNIDGDSNWREALHRQHVVIHSAARVHVMEEECDDPLAEYRRVNVEGTLALAREAIRSGVKRFIFISTIKVNGDRTEYNQPFTAFSKPAPEDAYGQSKLNAEQELTQLVKGTGMELVVIRPPLIYGPNVKGNFIRLIHVVKKQIPLPLGGIRNKRSFVSIDNLVDLILTCIAHPAAANNVFLVSDNHDLSTPELLTTLACAAGKSPRLFSVPKTILSLFAKVLSKEPLLDRLTENLQVDIKHTSRTLNWLPKVSVKDGMKRCFE